ncbi:MAG: glyoxalase [Cyanobacteriota/Melainabacteria group bacterium]
MIVRLHHAQITVPVGAEDEARLFTVGLLACKRSKEPQALAGRGGYWMGLNELQIHIGTEDGVDRFKSKAHIAYEVEDLEAAKVYLTGLGMVIPGASIGYDRFEFRDPFGNRVEFLGKSDN